MRLYHVRVAVIVNITNHLSLSLSLSLIVEDWIEFLFPELQLTTPTLNKTDTSSLCRYDIEVGVACYFTIILVYFLLGLHCIVHELVH